MDPRMAFFCPEKAFGGDSSECVRTDPEYGYDLGAGTEICRASPVSVFRTESFGGAHWVGADSPMGESRNEVIPIFSVLGQGTPRRVVFPWLVWRYQKVESPRNL